MIGSVLVVMLTAAAFAPAPLQEGPATPRDVGVEERPGAQLPLALDFVAEDGERVSLERVFGDEEGAPVLVVPGWFRCEMLCSVLVPRLRARLEEMDGWAARRAPDDVEGFS